MSVTGIADNSTYLINDRGDEFRLIWEGAVAVGSYGELDCDEEVTCICGSDAYRDENGELRCESDSCDQS